MSDARSRRGVPDRWLLPPPPADRALAARWEAMSFERRRSLARTGPASLAERSTADREVIVGLARRRLATSWRVRASGPVLGWLVLMTLWGFGRATYPATEQAWFLGGAALGAVAWSAAAVAAARRLRRARTLIGIAGSDDGSTVAGGR